jgi:hypothetical protein
MQSEGVRALASYQATVIWSIKTHSSKDDKDFSSGKSETTSQERSAFYTSTENENGQY